MIIPPIFNKIIFIRPARGVGHILKQKITPTTLGCTSLLLIKSTPLGCFTLAQIKLEKLLIFDRFKKLEKQEQARLSKAKKVLLDTLLLAGYRVLFPTSRQPWKREAQKRSLCIQQKALQ